MTLAQQTSAHEQRTHLIEWFIQDMIINRRTLLSRQESIDGRLKHACVTGGWRLDRETGRGPEGGERKGNGDSERKREIGERIHILQTAK